MFVGRRKLIKHPFKILLQLRAKKRIMVEFNHSRFDLKAIYLQQSVFVCLRGGNIFTFCIGWTKGRPVHTE